MHNSIFYNLLHTKSGSIGYLCTTIQNELIQLVSKQVKIEIFNEIRSAHFFDNFRLDLRRHKKLTLY